MMQTWLAVPQVRFSAASEIQLFDLDGGLPPPSWASLRRLELFEAEALGCSSSANRQRCAGVSREALTRA